MRLDAGAYARLLLMETNREVCTSSFRGIDIRKRFFLVFYAKPGIRKGGNSDVSFSLP